MKKNEKVELYIESLAFGGKAVAKKDGMVFFVDNAVPGDKIQAIITKKRKKYFEVIVDEILEKSELRTEAPCKYFDNCGGCSWQNINYIDQLEQKKKIVVDSLVRIGKLEIDEIDNILGSPLQFNYRNKMEFSFSSSRWLTKDEINSPKEDIKKDFAFGLHAPGRFDKVLDIDKCLLQTERANELYRVFRDYAINSGVSAYNHREHTGFLRNMIFRTSHSYNQMMIILIVNNIENEKDEELINWFSTQYINLLSENDTLILAVNNTNSPVNIASHKIIKGSGYITEKILDIDYRISPFSFFQTNSSHLDGFISEILSNAELKSSDIVWDLYCGAGSITLPASRKCKEIYGIELVSSAIEDAKENAIRNGIHNAKFYCEDLHKKDIPELLNTLPNPDVLIIDPPRAGTHINLIDHILKVEPKVIVYVSCNPTTQARDCELLSSKYKAVKLIPVDMFPHTYHVESICRLELK